MKTEDIKMIMTQRDALLEAERRWQKRHQESERVLQLLLVAGFVTEEQIQIARSLAAYK